MRVRSTLSLVVWLILLTLERVIAHSIRSQPADGGIPLETIHIHTPSGQVTVSSKFDLTFSFQGQNESLKLSLEPNNDILLQSSQIKYLDSKGETRATEIIDKESHKVFKGSVCVRVLGHDWKKAGWARIYMIQDGKNPLFEGAFSVSSQQYHVKPASNVMGALHSSTSRTQMCAYQNSRTDTSHTQDIRSPEDPTCAIDRNLWISGTRKRSQDTIGAFDARNSKISFALRKRQLSLDTGYLLDNIGNTAGCPTVRRVALVGIATDCSYTASFSSNEEIRRNIINMVNTASEVFENTFNVSLGLHNLTVSDAECPRSTSNFDPWNAPCSSGDLEWRLQRFSAWRGTLSDTTNAYWTLMTGCPTGSQVGVSLVGDLCNSRTSANVVALTTNEWQVFA
ncbi:hypothetical protein ARAM_003246 [Aspergillus rambellii]|uniref:Peptidase M12B domain-containing protein n=1 Tax=Aspergillus rambellii TaxID=308745 RepID=A0A0F8URW5_9EURO|nr:hypothetical protein ARAM_003246 [Aspergillus rambellii]